MNCPRCKTLMAETEKSCEPGSEQVRFECPTCSSVALSIRPTPKNPGSPYSGVDLIGGLRSTAVAAGGRQFRF